jgi:hypothetical protein
LLHTLKIIGVILIEFTTIIMNKNDWISFMYFIYYVKYKSLKVKWGDMTKHIVALY